MAQSGRRDIIAGAHGRSRVDDLVVINTPLIENNEAYTINVESGAR